MGSVINDNSTGRPWNNLTNQAVDQNVSHRPCHQQPRWINIWCSPQSQVTLDCSKHRTISIMSQVTKISMRLNNVSLPRFTGIVVQNFSFVGSFCNPGTGDAKLLWKVINLAKKELIPGLRLYCSCKQPVPLTSRGDTVSIHLCRKTLSAL